MLGLGLGMFRHVSLRAYPRLRTTLPKHCFCSVGEGKSERSERPILKAVSGRNAGSLALDRSCGRVP